MDIDTLMNFVAEDPNLSHIQKKELQDEQNKKKLSKLLSGAGGASLMLAVSRYANMSVPAQATLAALGFGAGRLIYDYYHRHKFATYNEDSGVYEIDTDRY